MGCNDVSTNFLDALSTSNSSSSFNITVSPTTSSAPKHYYQVFGPSQDNVAQEISKGDLYLCTPTYYSRNKVTPNGSDWMPPLLTPYSNLDGLRFTNPTDHSILDIYSSNGTLELLTGTFGALNQDSEYLSMLSASVEFPLGVVGRLGWNTVNDLPLQSVALNIILATLNHTDAEIQLDEIYASMLNSDASIPVPPQCSQAQASPDSANPWVASGIIPSHGTGMTQLGVVLQSLIILLCVLTLIILFTPILPLVSEWPAQWLGLVYGLSPSKVQEAVEGTSAGRNAAKDCIWGRGDEGTRARTGGCGLEVEVGMWLKGVHI
ncbi:hypothetical protein L207DRAFT_561559 [Hyaloscypha variabilis F]|uniref:Uncharacterized protein n=1 Tax=Hyaloscypha variabilis (strain UAMH 11265 / GT02V1 / F) TaxID=1149755 RepID=A0A2J6S5X1_HYAVF|nr:hypothetical protein L207DRAFT_561559 [Hyaloscypha variabilis F]